MGADYIAAGALAFVNHGNQQTDRETKPTIVHAEPSEMFQRTTEIEEKRSACDERTDFRYRDLVRVRMKLDELQRHKV